MRPEWDQEARDLLRRVKVDPKAGRPLRGRAPYRILDHGGGWRDQQLGTRFKVVRWRGPTPPEWERVGWRLVGQYGCRRDACREAKALRSVEEVLGA